MLKHESRLSVSHEFRAKSSQVESSRAQAKGGHTAVAIATAT